jgi:hypothetical protein
MGLVFLITWSFALSSMQEENLIALLNKTQHGTRLERRWKSGQVFASTWIESEKYMNQI